eukprot:gene461-3796_t
MTSSSNSMNTLSTTVASISSTTATAANPMPNTYTTSSAMSTSSPLTATTCSNIHDDAWWLVLAGHLLVWCILVAAMFLLRRLARRRKGLHGYVPAEGEVRAARQKACLQSSVHVNSSISRKFSTSAAQKRSRFVSHTSDRICNTSKKLQKEHRGARDRLISEQDAAYEASLQQDREKSFCTATRGTDISGTLNESSTAVSLPPKTEELHTNSTSVKMKQQKNIPPEPARDDNDRITVRCRVRGLTNDHTLSRMFSTTDTFEDLLVFLDRNGYSENQYTFEMPHPRVSVTDLRDLSFQDAGFPRQSRISIIGRLQS